MSAKTKNYEFMSQEQKKTNIFFLGLMKSSWFKNDHPGIDKMVEGFKKEIKDEKRKNKMKKAKQTKKCECFVVVVPKKVFDSRYDKAGSRTKKIVSFLFENEKFKHMTFKDKPVVVFGEVKIAGEYPDTGKEGLANYVAQNYKSDNPDESSDDEEGLSTYEVCDLFMGCFDFEKDSEVAIFRQFADSIDKADTDVNANLRIVVIPKAEYNKIYKKSSPATKRVVDFFTNAKQIETIKFAGVQCVMYTECILQDRNGFFECIENDYDYPVEDDESLADENWDNFDEEVGNHKTALNVGFELSCKI